MNNQLVQLKKDGKKLNPKTKLMTIDEKNRLAYIGTSNKDNTYTATEDCIVLCMVNWDGRININDVQLFNHLNVVQHDTYTLFLRKGDVLKTYSYSYTMILSYGVKYC